MTPENADDSTLSLRSDDSVVSVRRELTATGERLSLESDDGATRLDALALESLTWQDDEFFSELTGCEHTPGRNPVRTDEALQVGNEYTTIQLAVVETDDGPRLEVSSHKLGYSCRLGVAELVALSQAEMDLFSELLETPLGPVDDHDDDPLFH
ncbi:hypothetical protein [Halostella pelagica]|uniref:hypothetical protein n=1 Tax=Halostella pelagica TaxID=2583824 RepID=UPI001080B4EA|nr:hypothetical protein [Halostella pelagica]